MAIRLLNEEQVLDQKFRVRVIREIASAGNQARKREAKKRHEVFKDNTVKWVVQKLRDEGLKDSTIAIMVNRAANISICRKVIEKLGRCYSGGVQRDTGNEAGNELVADLAELLDFDQAKQKADRYRKLFKNTFVMIVPDLYRTEGEKEIYGLKMRVLAPWQYDVIENARDPETAGALILSDFVETSLLGLPAGDNSTSLAADTAKTAEKAERNSTAQTFIWWTDKYHFTTDEKGRIIKTLSPEDLLNPIQEIPGVTYAEDQDGCYWATGGEDLVDGAILVNTLLTDMFAIAYMQGWGQFVVTGKKIPAQLEGGPHSALVMTYDDGDPKPEVTVVNANPPLGDWMNAIEQYVALLLSTNNLSPGNVAVKLDPGAFPSGIAMLIEKSEATNSVETAQKQFRQGERKEWRIIKKWHNAYFESKSLDEEFSELGRVPEELEVQAKFLDTKEVITEKEKLETIKIRKELGINREVELIMIDNPGMSEADAKKKLLEIKKEKVENAAAQAAQVADGMNADEENEDDESDSDPQDG